MDPEGSSRLKNQTQILKEDTKAPSVANRGHISGPVADIYIYIHLLSDSIFYF